MKLLNRTIRSYLFYSITILLVAIPVFYFVVKGVLLHSVDHSLRTQMREIRKNLDAIQSVDELQAWAKMDKDIRLTHADRVFDDKIYTAYYADAKRHDEDPYREIAGCITVNGDLYSLVISNSLVENEDLLGSILLVQSILLILLMGGMLLINRASSKKIWQPFYKTLDGMKKYELSNHSGIEVEKTPVDEFNELNQALKQLTDRNYVVYLNQREFTENAAHELQTPLAIIQGKIDLLLQTEPLSEEQVKLINALEETNLRLAKLNKSLLLLSKIENNQFSEIEEIDLREALSKTLDQYRELADARKINIEEHYDNDLRMQGNRVQVEILLSNLVMNAIRHNVEGGEIKIEIHSRNIVIRNRGANEPLAVEKIFNRFYKSGQDSASIGLGLSIVKTICDRRHYAIAYDYREGWHTFTFSPDSN